MSFVIDHLTIPVRDRDATLEFYANAFGGKAGTARGRIVGLWLGDALELQFRTVDAVDSNHYAFRVDSGEFDAAVSRMRALGIPFGSNKDGRDGEVMGGDGTQRAIFFFDPNGHALELLTGA